MDALASSIRDTMSRWPQNSVSAPAFPPSLLSALEAISSRLPSSRDVHQEALQYLRTASLLARTAGAHSREVIRTAQRREAGYVKVVEKWFPASVEAWAIFEEHARLLSNGTLHGQRLQIFVASLVVLLSLIALLMRGSRTFAHYGDKDRLVTRVTSLSQTRSPSSEEEGAESSFTSDDSSEDAGLMSSGSAGLRRSTSPLGRKSSSPPTRSSRHFAVGSASKRAEKRSSIIRIVSSDPSSSLCHMPVEVDLLAPTTPSSHLQPQRSSSPSQAAAIALLKRRKKRLGVNSKTIGGDGIDLAAEISSVLASDDVHATGTIDETTSTAARSGGDSSNEESQRQSNRLTIAAAVPHRSSSPLQKAVTRNRPPLSFRRPPSPLQPDAPEPIPERTSSYHRLNGVIQALKPRVVGGGRTDAPPSILRKKSQVWTDADEENGDSVGNLSRSASSRSNRDRIVPDGRTGSSSPNTQLPQRSPTSPSRSGSSTSNVQGWRSSTFAASSSRSSHLHPHDHHKVKRLKAIRLTEPDWAPYVTMHERARERIEKRKENDKLKRTRLSSPTMMMSGSGSSAGSNEKCSGSAGSVRTVVNNSSSPSGSVKRRQRQQDMLPSSMENAGRPDVIRIDGSPGEDWQDPSSFSSPMRRTRNGSGLGHEMRRGESQPGSLRRPSDSVSASTTPRRRSSSGSGYHSSKFGMSKLFSSKPASINQADSGEGLPRVTADDADGEAESDFWFERYIPSTAAAGRDWDWRKRRARLRAEAESKETQGLEKNLRNDGKMIADEEVEDAEEDDEERYSMPLLGLEEGDDYDHHHDDKVQAANGTSSGVGKVAGVAGQYTIQGHTFSHGLVGTQLGYTAGGNTGLASPAGGEEAQRGNWSESPPVVSSIGHRSGRKKR